MKRQPLFSTGSPGRTRTSDMVVNSHPLYQLSYRGSWPAPGCLGRVIFNPIGPPPRGAAPYSKQICRLPDRF